MIHAVVALAALLSLADAQPFTSPGTPSQFSQALSEPDQRSGAAYTGFTFDLNVARVHEAAARSRYSLSSGMSVINGVEQDPDTSSDACCMFAQPSDVTPNGRLVPNQGAMLT
jgi:hypothetical protein